MLSQCGNATHACITNVSVLVMSKRKASYDITFKLKAVKCVEEKTKEAAARKFNVDPRNEFDE